MTTWESSLGKVVVVDAARTPFGKFQGSLAAYSAPQLAVHLLKHFAHTEAPWWKELEQEKLSSELLIGSVLTTGQGQGPARQVVLQGGIPASTPAVTLNKLCGSGLQAILWGALSILSGHRETVLAGGMESMSQAPHFLPASRKGYRFGHQSFIDSLLWDGLWDPHVQKTMGSCAELCARERKISRAEQDAYALESFERAQKAQAEGIWKKELIPLEGLSADEGITRLKKASVASLQPSFEPDGTITVANASSLNDGAGLVFLTSEKKAKEAGWKRLATLHSFATHSQAPEWFTTAPSGAIQKAVTQAGWKLSEVDLFEINEAFALVPLAVSRELGLSSAQVNVGGGALAIGHPLGASGARLVMALMTLLQHRGLRRGVASLCIGGGEAIAVCVEV